MYSDKLAVQQAAWSVKVQRCLTAAGFTFKHLGNSYATIFMVRHPSSTGWVVYVDISCSRNRHNRLNIDHKALFTALSKHSDDKLVEALRGSLNRWLLLAADAKMNETEAAKWAARQEKDLAGLPDIRGIDISIIRTGTLAGQFALAFTDGHPLETLDKEDLGGFYAYLHSIGKVNLLSTREEKIVQKTSRRA